MLAKATSEVPETGGLLFEPKWDGFRALIFRDGDALYLQSREKKPLLRYFPELDAPLKASLPDRCVVDGEIVIATGHGLDFEALQMRLHPAASRIAMLAKKTPASFVAFDLLACGDDDLCPLGFGERRARLEQHLSGCAPPVYLTPMTRDRAVAQDWFVRFEGAGLDGVMAKAEDAAYQPKKRAMLKIKHRRTTDVVVAGFRWHKKGPGTLLGSLLLGLYDDDGKLHHVGVTSSFTMQKREALVTELAPWRENALDGHPWGEWVRAMQDAEHDGRRQPGMQSRWSVGKDLSWEPLRPERVAEVAYDHVQSGRFRHAATFKRWRDDREPHSCTYEQLEVTPPYELGRIFKLTP
jgi:ATP-dependent DNA ligase